MTEEKDIVGLSVPFAAGAAVGTLLLYAVHCPFSLASATVIALAISLFLTLRSPKGRLPGIAVSLVFCGMLCALSQSLSAPFEGSGALTDVAHGAAAWLRNTIDCIPYDSDACAPLVKALLTGDRTGLSKELTTTFRAAGASHILALSGLHLGLVYIILLRLTSFFGNSIPARHIRCSLIILTSAFYAVATGGSHSIIRAFLFITLGEIAKLTGRERKPLRIYCSALFIQLAVSPSAIESIGFWLSYLAMAGIVLVYPRLRAWYPPSDRWDIVRRIWDAAALSISCQLFTAPLVLAVFGTFPKYFLLTNLLVMPLTSAVMFVSIGTVTLSALGICPLFIVALNEKILGTLLWTLRIISEM